MMQRAESAFWTSQNSSYVRPVDVAVRKISSFEAVGFVRGVRSVFNVIEAADPDIIFLGIAKIWRDIQRQGKIQGLPADWHMCGSFYLCRMGTWETR